MNALDRAILRSRCARYESSHEPTREDPGGSLFPPVCLDFVRVPQIPVPRLEFPHDEEFKERELLRQVIRGVRRIRQATCVAAPISLASLMADQRTMDVVVPRHCSWYLCRLMTTASTTMIGKQFGGRDHTTVLHGVCKVAAKLASGDPVYVDMVAKIRAKVEEWTGQKQE